jgi:hypothetical protein
MVNLDAPTGGQFRDVALGQRGPQIPVGRQRTMMAGGKQESAKAKRAMAGREGEL